MNSIRRKYRVLRHFNIDAFTAGLLAVLSEIIQGPVPNEGGVLRVLSLEFEIPGVDDESAD
jgi:hypothetical protein